MHGGSLLVGTVAVMLGFATGVMYLVQSYRLKHKLPPREGFKLPSLEWLQGANREALFVSTGFLALGLIAGIVLNLTASRSGGGVDWWAPEVLSSAGLLVWLIAAMLFESFYKPARQGRKVAYLTLASFLFLGFVLVLVLSSGHAIAHATPARPPAAARVAGIAAAPLRGGRA